MKYFASTMIAVCATAGFVPFEIDEDGEILSMVLSTKDWSSATASGRNVSIKGNNSMFLRNSEDLTDGSIYKTLLRGGSIEYDVDVSG